MVCPVYMTQTISTIVDRLYLSFSVFGVYMTQTISTIVDFSEVTNLLTESI